MDWLLLWHRQKGRRSNSVSHIFHVFPPSLHSNFFLAHSVEMFAHSTALHQVWKSAHEVLKQSDFRATGVWCVTSTSVTRKEMWHMLKDKICVVKLFEEDWGGGTGGTILIPRPK